jgi:hypothetical protein
MSPRREKNPPTEKVDVLFVSKLAMSGSYIFRSRSLSLLIKT